MLRPSGAELACRLDGLAILGLHLGRKDDIRRSHMGTLSWIGCAQRAALCLARSVGLGAAVQRSLLGASLGLISTQEDAA